MAKSNEIKKNDGRKWNKRLAPKPISTKDKMIPAAKSNKSKRDRMESRTALAIKKAYGSEQEFLNYLAEMSKKSYNYMKLLMEYRYGKVADSIDKEKRTQSKSAPQITFNVTQTPQKLDQGEIIDVTPEDDQ